MEDKINTILLSLSDIEKKIDKLDKKLNTIYHKSNEINEGNTEIKEKINEYIPYLDWFINTTINSLKSNTTRKLFQWFSPGLDLTTNLQKR